MALNTANNVLDGRRSKFRAGAQYDKVMRQIDYVPGLAVLTRAKFVIGQRVAYYRVLPGDRVLPGGRVLAGESVVTEAGGIHGILYYLLAFGQTYAFQEAELKAIVDEPKAPRRYMPAGVQIIAAGALRAFDVPTTLTIDIERQNGRVLRRVLWWDTKRGAYRGHDSTGKVVLWGSFEPKKDIITIPIIDKQIARAA